MARTELSSPLGLAAEFSHLLNKAVALEKESLEKPIMRLMKVNKFNEETARMLRVEFLRFCVLKYHNPDQIFPPSAEVDSFWHAFILHTMDYHDFCEKHFGAYLHHTPMYSTHLNHPEATGLAEYNTHKMIGKMFPGYNKALWEKPA